MRFSAGLVTTLVASVHALPRVPNGGTRVFQARKEGDAPVPSPSSLPGGGGDSPENTIGDTADDDDDDDDKSPEQIVEDAPEFIDGNKDNPNKIKTCPADAKTQENWVNYGIGEWFEVLANGEDYSKDIQKTLLGMGYTPNIYNFHCEPMQHCDASFDMEDCVSSTGTAGMYFILHGIINFSNFLTSLANSVDQTHGIVDGKAAKIVDEFSSAPDDLTIPSAPGVLTAGIIGMIGALFTGPLAIGAAIGGALATTAVGIIGLINEGQSIELEPKFNDFADVTSYLADASSTVQKAIEDYARWVLTSTPDNDRDNDIYYIEDPRALPHQLLDGGYAEPVEVDRLPDSLFASLFSGAITELWNKEQVFVIKIRSDEALLDNPPCDESGPFVGRRYCDDDGNSYVLLKYPELHTFVEKPWTDEGKSEWMDFKGYDKLEDYGLSIEMVAKASENAFNRNGKKAGIDWNPDSVMEYMMEDSSNMLDFVTFNFPFCDMGPTGTPLRIEEDDCDAECQIIFAASKRCILALPYNTQDLISWEDSCSWIPGKCKYECGVIATDVCDGDDDD